MNRLALVGFVASLLCYSCAQQPVAEYPSKGELIEVESVTNQAEDGITGVAITEVNDTSYQLSVTIQSSDTGCNQYANWWEVITEDGRLLYRRILAHCHVDEQPFTRSGGPVEIEADEVVIVRSHMYPTGYHTQAMKGSFTEGFEPATLPADFATELAETDPLPTGCTF